MVAWRCPKPLKTELALICSTQPLSFASVPFCLKDFLAATRAKNPSQKPHFLGSKTQLHCYKMKEPLMVFTDCTFDMNHLWHPRTWRYFCSSCAYSPPTLASALPLPEHLLPPPHTTQVSQLLIIFPVSAKPSPPLESLHQQPT